ncbi:myoD family inhibitor domain-containing protein 2 [Fundulus heteroclitus]|uniref:myoD family inhibitor domain-containing protein 2 n=1 Tax=Fundulus heteroclitus TaxID=8078 RepID=UPI00165C0BBF|nr:myoD family inhibitor domain-containing protein 2 [Fundulus heteroclitus]
MEQKAVETTLKPDVKDKGIVNIHEGNPAWARGERFQSRDKAGSVRWTASVENETGETSGDLGEQGETLFPPNKHPRKSSSPSSGITNDLSSSPKSNMGVDCADIVLNCLFCRFHDMIPILPDCCQRLTNHCWPNYKQVDRTVESTHSDDDDSCVELDCGFCGSCHDASDCLELAMEVSEICYH